VKYFSEEAVALVLVELRQLEAESIAKVEQRDDDYYERGRCYGYNVAVNRLERLLAGAGVDETTTPT
jgi:hypothetical protein